jgi:hypothetical protein
MECCPKQQRRTINVVHVPLDIVPCQRVWIIIDVERAEKRFQLIYWFPGLS